MGGQDQGQDVPEVQTTEAEQPAPSASPAAEPPSPLSLKQILQFVGGLLGWFLVNYAAYWLFFGGKEATTQAFELNLLACLILPANVILFIVLVLKRATRQIAWGMLTAIGMNFIASQILGLSLNAICMVPFFYQ